MSSDQKGLTLIELLIIIAVIAILAAILFPVFGRVREQARQSTCMSNMHSIYVAATLFHQDNSKWPCLLLGITERTPDHLPWQPNDGYANAVPASGIHARFLYPAYIKNIETFHCPDNPDNDLKKAITPDYPNASPKAGVLSGLLNGHT